MVVIDPGLAPAKEGIAVDTIPQPLAGAGYSPAVRVRRTTSSSRADGDGFSDRHPPPKPR